MAKILAITAAVILLVVGSSVRAPAAEITIEAESYTSSHDLGLDPILGSRTILTGLDIPGEYTGYSFPAAELLDYNVMILCWGDEGVDYTLELVVQPALIGRPSTTEFTFTGLGFGG